MVLLEGRSEERLLESFQLTGFHAFRAARTGFCAFPGLCLYTLYTKNSSDRKADQSGVRICMKFLKQMN